MTSIIRRLLWILLPAAAFNAAAEEIPAGITVREGYTLTVAESKLKGQRFMVLDPAETLYVSLPNEGRIVALRDADGDGAYDVQSDYVTGHKTVHGMCWNEGSLWFTESTGVFRAKDTNGDFVADETVKLLAEPVLPEGGGHWWRSILIHGGRIYTSIGDTGNATDQRDTKRQKVWSYALDGTDEQLYCTGIRNTEKLVVRPGTDEIWGMDHGSDSFGTPMEEKDKEAGIPITSMNPPCELNRLDKGAFYGHPWITGDRLPRPEFMDREDIVKLAAQTTPPMWKTGAHWAPNAMTFYDADTIPDARGDAFVAYHGSWNRTDAAGYCVTRVSFEDGKPWGERKVVDFWAKDADDGKGKAIARPVDVVVDRDGSLLISDDGGNKIYRLRYTGK